MSRRRGSTNFRLQDTEQSAVHGKNQEIKGTVERLLLLEGNPISLVFQNIDPPAFECVPPAFVGGEDTLAGGRGGWGVNILEDERNRIALLQ